MTDVNKQELEQFILKIERLEEEKKGLASDINDIFKELSNRGYNTGIIKQVIKLRRMERDKLEELDHLLDLYRSLLNI
jgi:uncharacterized protein (UPF0335 family)